MLNSFKSRVEKIKKASKITLSAGVLIGLTACGGESRYHPSGDPQVEPELSKLTSQLRGNVSGASIVISTLDGVELGSGYTNESGELVINVDEFKKKLVENGLTESSQLSFSTTGGTDTDPDGDGDATNDIDQDVNGTSRIIASFNDMKDGYINAFSGFVAEVLDIENDPLYWNDNGDFNTVLYSEKSAQLLEQVGFTTDVNGDNIVDYKDLNSNITSYSQGVIDNITNYVDSQYNGTDFDALMERAEFNLVGVETQRNASTGVEIITLEKSTNDSTIEYYIDTNLAGNRAQRLENPVWIQYMNGVELSPTETIVYRENFGFSGMDEVIGQEKTHTNTNNAPLEIGAVSCDTEIYEGTSQTCSITPEDIDGINSVTFTLISGGSETELSSYENIGTYYVDLDGLELGEYTVKATVESSVGATEEVETDSKEITINVVVDWETPRNDALNEPLLSLDDGAENIDAEYLISYNTARTILIEASNPAEIEDAIPLLYTELVAYNAAIENSNAALQAANELAAAEISKTTALALTLTALASGAIDPTTEKAAYDTARATLVSATTTDAINAAVIVFNTARDAYNAAIGTANENIDITDPILSSATKAFVTTLGNSLTLETVTATDNIDGTVTVVQGGDTVNFNAIGTYNVTYTATDAAGNSSIITHTYTVNAVPNTAPTATDITRDAGWNDVTTYNLNVNISDTESTDANLTISVVSGPSHGALSWNGNEFTYTVTDGSGYGGDDSFTYKVIDEGTLESSVKTVTITNIADT